MSFIFETIDIPFWFLLFVIGSASPLWINWYKKFHKKFIATGVLQGKFRRAKSTAEQKMDILQKATDHWNANSEMQGFTESEIKEKKKSKTSIDPVKKHNIKVVLKVLAESGETGVLTKSIADKTGIRTLNVNDALMYLADKKYAEVITGPTGTKYYLTELGRNYCINKKYISE